MPLDFLELFLRRFFVVLVRRGRALRPIVERGRCRTVPIEAGPLKTSVSIPTHRTRDGSDLMKYSPRRGGNEGRDVLWQLFAEEAGGV
jgi:hypothetical protein